MSNITYAITTPSPPAISKINFLSHHRFHCCLPRPRCCHYPAKLGSHKIFTIMLLTCWVTQWKAQLSITCHVCNFGPFAALSVHALHAVQTRLIHVGLFYHIVLGVRPSASREAVKCFVGFTDIFAQKQRLMSLMSVCVVSAQTSLLLHTTELFWDSCSMLMLMLLLNIQSKNYDLIRFDPVTFLT